jgi:hypothetical protein
MEGMVPLLVEPSLVALLALGNLFLIAVGDPICHLLQFGSWDGS